MNVFPMRPQTILNIIHLGKTIDMNKPIGFEKIVNYANSKPPNSLNIVMGLIEPHLRSMDILWVSPLKLTSEYKLLYIFDWGRNHWHIRMCKSDTGWYGVWYDTYLPMSVDDIQTVGSFYNLINESANEISNTINSVPKIIDYIESKSGDTSPTLVATMQLPLTVSQPRAYVVQSESGPNQYIVKLDQLGEWECSCPAFMYSKVVPNTCKHITKVKKDTKFPF